MLDKEIAQLQEWIRRDLGRYADPEKLWQTARFSADGLNGTTAVLWDLDTRRNRYHFRLAARPGTHPVVAEPVPPYFGLQAMSRTWRAGEDWHRGNDLSDGPFSEELWRRMLTDIVSYEADEPSTLGSDPAEPSTLGSDPAGGNQPIEGRWMNVGDPVSSARVITPRVAEQPRG